MKIKKLKVEKYDSNLYLDNLNSSFTENNNKSKLQNKKKRTE